MSANKHVFMLRYGDPHKRVSVRLAVHKLPFDEREKVYSGLAVSEPNGDKDAWKHINQLMGELEDLGHGFQPED